MAEEAAPEPGAGDVPIVLKGETKTLRPSLAACIALSRSAGGIAGAIERCSRMDFDTICDVISAGLGANPNQRQRLVEPTVYETGLISLAPDCILFLRVIANGGKMPPDHDEPAEVDDEAEDPLPPSASQ